jgi:hypothetical protein
MRFFICLLLLLPHFLQGQCYTPKGVSNLYSTIPRFISLYNNGDCVTKDISDTTICIKVRPRSFGQLAYFSYSTPFGQPVSVSIEQFNKFCQRISTNNEIYPSTDTTLVCYTIKAELIDNFCPYVYRFITLAVDWCGVSCFYKNGILQVDWATCANKNTSLYEVLVSPDAKDWKKVAETPPHFTNYSGTSTYRSTVSFTVPGEFYVCVREIDYNGEESYSEICSFTAPLQPLKPIPYDLLGRQVSGSYKWAVR